MRLVYVGLVFHVCSSGVFLMGNARLAVVTCISYSLSVGRVFWLWVILCMLVV